MNGGIRVLIVDDDPGVLSMVQTALSSSSCEVYGARTIQEGQVQSNIANPDVMLIDVGLPDGSGLSLLKWVRERLNEVELPIVVITGTVDDAVRFEALQSGANLFLAKPFPSTDLIAHVKTLSRIKTLHLEEVKRHEQLQQTERYRDLMESFIAHDLKNSIFALLGWIDILDREVQQKNDKTKTAIEYIREEAGGMTVLAGNLIEAHKLECGAFPVRIKAFDVVETAKMVVSRHRALVRIKRLQLTEDYPEQSLEVESDEWLVSRVIENLLMNAYRACSFDGSVTIFVREGESIQIGVQDTGCGIAQEDLSKLFRKYGEVIGARPKGRKNFGLGLFFCKLAMEALGGSISLESRLNQGSTFTMNLRKRF